MGNNFRKSKVDKLSDADLLRMHWQEQMNMDEIALTVGLTGTSGYLVSQAFRERHLKRRTRSEAHILAHKLHPERYPILKRELSSSWNGGRAELKNGYVKVIAPLNYKGICTYKPRTPNCSGSMLEHRLVWEQTHGRLLKKGEIVHHLNGIKNDNRPENLVAVNRHNHERHTFTLLLQGRIRELEQLRMRL